MTRLTHLGRGFTPARPSYRWLLIIGAATAIAGLLWPTGRTPLDAMVRPAITVGLTWALVRELAPDQPRAALIAATIAGAVSIAAADTDVVALAAVMLAARITVRSTGLRPYLTDIVAVGAFVGVFARTPLAWAGGLAVAAAVALDTSLPEPSPQRNGWLAMAIGVAVTVSAVASQAMPRAWGLPDTLTLGLAAVAVVAMAAAPSSVESVDDHRRLPLDPIRVRAARRLAVAAVLLGTLVGGATYASASWPAWTGLVVAAVAARIPSEPT